MKRIHVLGMGLAIGNAIAITSIANDLWTPSIINPVSPDPFHGGGRSKGEKKRAARDRRSKGGY